MSLDQLAAKLGRPPSALSAFEHLTEDEIGRLSHLIEDACARQRETLNTALDEAMGALPRPIRRRIIGSRAR